MSIAEKLTTVAENVPKVYKAGQASMVDESKIVPKTVSGTSISVNDVSELPHDVSCKVESINLFEPTKESAYSKGITLTRNDDNSYTVSGTSDYDKDIGFILGTFQFDKIVPHCLSGGTKDFPLLFGLCKDGESLGLSASIKDGTRPMVEFEHDFNSYRVYVVIKPSETVNATVKPMITLYDSSMEKPYPFTPYVSPESIQVIKYGADESEDYQTFTPNAEGIVDGIKSTSPYMNILSDTEGVLIEATYHKSWGMQVEYDRVWDDLQQNGNRTYYNTYFASRGWISGTTYNPKYPITCTANGASSMFGSSYVTDTLVPISISGANASVFYGSSIVTIPLLILGSGITSMGDWFTNMANLKDITIEGEIYVSTKFAQSTKLTAKSMVSIVEHLSPTASSKTLTFSATAVANADWSTTDYSSFDELIATKPNWTIGV